jgi:hypothetical protein
MIKLKSLLGKNVEQMKFHILKLCKLYNIKIKYISNCRDSYAHFPTKTVYIVPIESDISYSVALHEIAHCLKEGDPFDIDDEIIAWKWAKKNALIWTSKMQKSMEGDIQNYIPSGPADSAATRYKGYVDTIKSI